MNTIADRILQRMTDLDLTQDALAKLAGVSQTAIHKLITGKSQRTRYLVQIARALQCDPEWLAAGSGETDGSARSHPAIPPGASVVAWDTLDDLPDGGAAYVLVPHFDVSLSAGDGCCCEWHEHADNEPLSFRAKWFQARGLNPTNCKALYVRGSSMDPTLVEGDTVMIDTSRADVRDGVIYAVIYHGELYVKRLYRIPGGGIELRSDNPAHRPREVTGADLDALFVLGEKVWRAG